MFSVYFDKFGEWRKNSRCFQDININNDSFVSNFTIYNHNTHNGVKKVEILSTENVHQVITKLQCILISIIPSLKLSIATREWIRFVHFFLDRCTWFNLSTTIIYFTIDRWCALWNVTWWENCIFHRKQTTLLYCKRSTMKDV